MKYLKQHGFTLVELITMIVIVGVLAAVAIPKYIDLTAQAKAAKCISNQAVLESAASIAYAQNVIKGEPAYPNALDDLAIHIKHNFTTTCSDGTTALSYNNSNGLISCPNDNRN